MKLHHALLPALAATLTPARAAAEAPGGPLDGPTTMPSQVPAAGDRDDRDAGGERDAERPTPVERAMQPASVVFVGARVAEPRWYTIPPRYETYTDRVHAERFGVGAVLFAGTYLASFAMAVRADDTVQDRGNENLFIPIAGPWVALGERSSCPVVSCGDETVEKSLLVASGLAQAAGAILMVSAFLQPSRHQVLANPLMAGRTIQIVPTASATTAGLSMSGRF